ncbi:hypothetical protein Asulf_01307 [Archaeoglobus sulfaticallidus PM70-1]|uniref:Uncharacterized protein n=1 Tax=Archaeoglobus sulfaticallidus PM70-1 TaxID=387631 RepID=N0BE54_9EURY|nr:hypothetical protein [Archaeoglobus sulfaticallidus]AGK61298.1 hypothetical protein Asulf_01307 [Archaeoglobus sulfaticallidus PM70-1]
MQKTYLRDRDHIQNVMAQNTESLRKEIFRLKREMDSLKRRLEELELELTHRSVEDIKSELKEEYPDIDFDDDLLALVGTIPPNPPEMDKQIVREAVEKVLR